MTTPQSALRADSSPDKGSQDRRPAIRSPYAKKPCDKLEFEAKQKIRGLPLADPCGRFDYSGAFSSAPEGAGSAGVCFRSLT